LETHQECHHFEVSDDLPAILIILQGVQTGLDVVVIFFEVHRVSQRKRRVLVPIMEQHDFEAPG
jgi:replication-associated recombination protein RarA